MQVHLARRLSALLAGAILAVLAISTPAVEPEWTYPTIKGFGKVVPLPNAGMQPSKTAEYKVVFNLTAAGDADKLNPSLDKLARAVNIFTSAGVPISHLHFVGVVHGPGTPMVLDNAHYREKFGVDNPNIKVIDALEAAGTKVVVCGQAVAHTGLQNEWIYSKVELTLSAITDLVLLEQQGYVFIQL